MFEVLKRMIMPSALKATQKEYIEHLKELAAFLRKVLIQFDSLEPDADEGFLSGIQPATGLPIYFKEEPRMLGDERDNDRGFKLLETTREQVIDVLLPLASDKNARNELWREIYDAFENNSLRRTPRFSELYEKQKDQLLSKEEREIARSDLRAYCQRREVYRSYIESYRGNLWLGYKSAFLYASKSGITLYGWRNLKGESSVDPISVAIPEKSTKVIHLFLTRTYVHFDCLKEVQKPVQQKSQLSEAQVNLELGDGIYLPHAFLILINQIKKLERGFIWTLFKERSLEDILNDIFSRQIDTSRGTILLKEPNNAVFYDKNGDIAVECLRNMTDLQFLFLLNSYDLPYCSSTQHRSIYEHFLQAFLDKVVPTKLENLKSHEAHRYKFLEASIPQLRTIAESYLQIVCCVSEIIKVVNVALKQAWHDALDLNELDELPIDDVIRWFGGNKIFDSFNLRGLLLAQTEDERPENRHKLTTVTKIDKFNSALFSQIQNWMEGCENKIEELEGFRKSFPYDERAKKFCDDLIVFTRGFNQLLKMLQDEQGPYQLAFAKGRKLLEQVGKELESTPVSPRIEHSTGSLSPRMLRTFASAQASTPTPDSSRKSPGSPISPKIEQNAGKFSPGPGLVAPIGSRRRLYDLPIGIPGASPSRSDIPRGPSILSRSMSAEMSEPPKPCYSFSRNHESVPGEELLTTPGIYRIKECQTALDLTTLARPSGRAMPGVKSPRRLQARMPQVIDRAKNHGLVEVNGLQSSNQMTVPNGNPARISKVLSTSKEKGSFEKEAGKLTKEFERYSLFVHEKKDTSEKRGVFAQIIPKGLKLGMAKGEGDCFFDACSEALNELLKGELYTLKDLRILCDRYAKKLLMDCGGANGGENNPDNWIAVLFNGDLDEYNQYLLKVGSTAEELKQDDALRNNKDALWGDQNISAQIIAKELGIKIHIIELHENPNTEEVQKIIVNHNLVDANKFISLGPDAPFFDNRTIHIAVCDNHFVPILREATTQGNLGYRTEAQKDREKSEKRGVTQIKRDGYEKERKSEMSEQSAGGQAASFGVGPQILVPANGNCFFISILLSYLLCVIDNSDEFYKRLDKILSLTLDQKLALREDLRENYQNIRYLNNDSGFIFLINTFKEVLGNAGWGGNSDDIAKVEKLLNIKVVDVDENVARDDSKGKEETEEVRVYIFRCTPCHAEVSSIEDDPALQQGKMASVAASGQHRHFRVYDFERKIESAMRNSARILKKTTMRETPLCSSEIHTGQISPKSGLENRLNSSSSYKISERLGVCHHYGKPKKKPRLPVGILCMPRIIEKLGDDKHKRHLTGLLVGEPNRKNFLKILAGDQYQPTIGDYRHDIEIPEVARTLFRLWDLTAQNRFGGGCINGALLRMSNFILFFAENFNDAQLMRDIYNAENSVSGGVFYGISYEDEKIKMTLCNPKALREYAKQAEEALEWMSDSLCDSFPGELLAKITELLFNMSAILSKNSNETSGIDGDKKSSSAKTFGSRK